MEERELSAQHASLPPCIAQGSDGTMRTSPTVKRVIERRRLCAKVNPSSVTVHSVTPRVSAVSLLLGQHAGCRVPWRVACMVYPGREERAYTGWCTYPTMVQGCTGRLPTRVYLPYNTVLRVLERL